MSKVLFPIVLYTLVGITAEGYIVPIQYDPDVGRYSRSVDELKKGFPSPIHLMTPQTVCNKQYYQQCVDQFKPNESYYPGIVRLEIREFHFVGE